jgi:hypothetical protein
VAAESELVLEATAMATPVLKLLLHGEFSAVLSVSLSVLTAGSNGPVPLTILLLYLRMACGSGRQTQERGKKSRERKRRKEVGWVAIH